MAYQPTTWKSGDVVTSTKLNKLETAAAPFIVTFTVDWGEEENPTATADKTIEQIETAWVNGMTVYFELDGTIVPAFRVESTGIAWKASCAEYQSNLMSVVQGSIDESDVFFEFFEYTMTAS